MEASRRAYKRNVILNSVRQHNYFITQGNYIGNTTLTSTRQFHRSRSYDNKRTPTKQQEKTYSDVTSKYIVPHSSKNNQTVTGLIFVK